MRRDGSEKENQKHGYTSGRPIEMLKIVSSEVEVKQFQVVHLDFFTEFIIWHHMTENE